MRGGGEREECRVEGEIYLLAARADKIIRQKTPGVDDGEARGGEERMEERKEEAGRAGREGGRGSDQARTRGGSRSEERKRNAGEIGPVRSERMGKSRIADAVDAVRRTKRSAERGAEGCRGSDQKRRKPDRNARTNASCYGLPNRDAYLARE